MFKTCLICGGDFPVKPGLFEKRRTCSRACAAEDRRRRMTVPVAERFWEKVDKDGPIPAHRPDLGPCWIWTGAKFRGGYGQFAIGMGLPHIGAHCWAYEELVGPIPDGHDLDHLCRTPACVNPGHLEPVLNRENFMRGMHPNAIVHLTGLCRRGHPITEGNVRRRSDGRQQCLTCFLAAQQRSTERRRVSR